MSTTQERTERPTAKKLGDARRRGKVARSRDLAAVAVLAGGGCALLWSVEYICGGFQELIAGLWAQGFAAPIDRDLFLTVTQRFAMMLLPVAIGTSVAALGINLAQLKGFMISTQTLQPSFGKLNPLQGFKRFTSLRSLVELIKSLLKVAVIGWMSYEVVHSEMGRFELLVDQELADIAGYFSTLAVKIGVRVMAVMLVLGLADFFYQKWQHRQDLKMTRQEVKEEHKQSEGNPQIKSRIRAIQRAMARQRMMAAVPGASVVITNPTHYAVALLYGTDLEAPRVVAKGADLLARRIIGIARDNGVPVVQNPPLARALYKQVRVDETIPVTLYKAVAKVLAYIYQQKKARPV